MLPSHSVIICDFCSHCVELMILSYRKHLLLKGWFG